jgi:hypothetical protein
MKYVWAITMAVLLSNVAFAGDEGRNIPPQGTENPEAHDVCDYKSRDWSAMRQALKAISRFRGRSDANVQQIARKALAGARRFSIGEFEIVYARGMSGSPPPNDGVCYPKEVTFSAVRNNGNDAAYACKAEFDVKGKVTAIYCELTAG